YAALTAALTKLQSEKDTSETRWLSLAEMIDG
ncbi:MAG: hypothetical protein RLY97_1187, partial [Pseudomonadota bacterium]